MVEDPLVAVDTIASVDIGEERVEVVRVSVVEYEM